MDLGPYWYFIDGGRINVEGEFHLTIHRHTAILQLTAEFKWWASERDRRHKEQNRK